MSNTDPTPTCGILYVDDEEKALKYFRMAFSEKYHVFTAASGQEGIELLRREAARIGIVISDQRMPGMLGADFLGRVREEYPYLVRILTTAFSDLDSAIQAVNTGHIYQYVVKPWNVDDFGMVLQRAADYYRVLSERNELLALKMTTLQRVICSDRVKGLLLAGRDLDETVRPVFFGAVAALVKALPESLRPTPEAAGGFTAQRFEITSLIRNEYRQAVRYLDALAVLRHGVATDAHTIKDSLEALVSPLASACGFSANEASITIDNATATLQMPACEEKILAKALFGLLLDGDDSAEVSGLLFDVLVTVGMVSGSLTVRAGEASPLVFSPVSIADADVVINELYEKFAASDISRL